MRVSLGMKVAVFGYGMPFSGVPTKFDGEVCTVRWADEETDDQFVSVQPEYGEYCAVHAIQCVPLPKGMGG